MMYGYYAPGMGWWMVLNSLLWLGLLAVAVWALVRFVAHRPNAGTGHDAASAIPGPSAEEILRQRFARGELDADTFARMRTQLEQAIAREQATPRS